MGNQELVIARRSLHAVAELVLAGPQYRATGKLRLRVVPGGFATVLAPELRAVGTGVVGRVWAEGKLTQRDRRDQHHVREFCRIVQLERGDDIGGGRRTAHASGRV